MDKVQVRHGEGGEGLDVQQRVGIIPPLAFQRQRSQFYLQTQCSVALQYQHLQETPEGAASLQETYLQQDCTDLHPQQLTELLWVCNTPARASHKHLKPDK